jgi:MFS family permease
MALVVRFTVREPPRGLSDRVVGKTQEYTIGEVWRFFSTLPAARNASLAGAFHAFVGYGLGAWLPAFFIRVHSMTPGSLGRWLSWITALGGIIGAFAGGWIADRWVRSNPRARPYVGLIGVLLSIPPLFFTLLVADTEIALWALLPYNIATTLWLGPTIAVIQDLVPPAMRATASAVFLFIVTIIGLGAGPQVIGILNDLGGTPDAIRYSLLSVAIIMNIIAAWFFWKTATTLAQDLGAKKRL